MIIIRVNKNRGKPSMMKLGDESGWLYPVLDPEWSDDKILSKLFWQTIPLDSVKIIRTEFRCLKTSDSTVLEK